jgi:hypothetical protein
MKQDFPNSGLVGKLALSIYNSQNLTIKAMELEVAKEEDEEKRKPLQQKVDEVIGSALRFALEYVDSEPEPQYGLLRSASKLALKVNDLNIAERLCDIAIRKYGSVAAMQDKIDKWVKPDQAEIMLKKRDFARALALAEDAIKALQTQTYTPYELYELKARALGGWTEERNREVVKVLGLERFEEAYKLYWDHYRKFVDAKFGKYSPEWYHFYLGCTYYLSQAATQPGAPSKSMELSRTCYNIAKSTDNFERLRSYGSQGQTLFRMFEAIKPR